jgi:uncharacterized protein (TIGR00297 family)
MSSNGDATSSPLPCPSLRPNYDKNVNSPNLNWQSKLVLLLVIAPVAINVAWQSRFWLARGPQVAAWSLGLSALLGLLAWKSRSGTLPAALAGALICASMMFSTFVFPYHPWQTAIVPILTVLVLTSLATRFGRKQKEKIGIAEEKRGRNAAQVCANLGFAALVCTPIAQSWLIDAHRFAVTGLTPILILAPALAALAEAAADTISSELGQVLGGTPRMITTLQSVPAGTDGAISAAGTLSGAVAAAIIAAAGAWAMNGGWNFFAVSAAGGIFGLLFDSLLGATIERKGWLNNDAVNFLSTASAAIFTLVVLALLPHPGVG